MTDEREHDEPLFGVEAVAARLGVQPTTVHRWCREGRLACLKPGKSWRVRASSLETFLREGERPRSLLEHLRAFITVPDHLVAVAEDEALLWRLDATFFRLGDEQGARLVKFLGGETTPREVLRDGLRRHGLDVERLEGEGRFCWSTAVDPAEERGTEVGRSLEAAAREGCQVWASCNWTREVDLGEMIAQQARLAALIDPARLVVKTAAIEAAAADWSHATLRQAQSAGRGLIRLGRDGFVLSRAAPLPAH
jgi:excisionase family DNA binding protein